MGSLFQMSRELIKSLGNDIMFIDGELGAALEHSISIEPVDSEQLHSHSPSSSLVIIIFFLIVFISILLNVKFESLEAGGAAQR